MSNALLTPPAGRTPIVTRAPLWGTVRRSSVSGREFRSATQSYPRYRIIWEFEFLRQGQHTGAAYTEFNDLVGFFNARQGGFDSFLITDPDDNAATAQTIGVGDAATTQFQLVRTFGGFVEPVFDVNGAPLIYKNAVLQATPADYTVGSTGVVTFTAAPAAAAALTWTGAFYRRVAFVQDVAELTQFLRNLWRWGRVELITCKP